MMSSSRTQHNIYSLSWFQKACFRWKEYIVQKYPLNVNMCPFSPEVGLEDELIYIRLKMLPSFCNTQTVNSGAKKKSSGVE